MFGKRIVAFLAIVVVAFAVMAGTSPWLLKGVKLGLDLKGGFEVLYEAVPYEGGVAVTPESLKQTANSLQKRVDASGLVEPEITTEGANRIRVKLPGVENEEEVRNLLAKPINLTFRAPDGEIMLTGTDFVENAAGLEFNELNRPVVTIKLKNAKKFEEVTSKLVGQTMSIYLDEQEISSPRVNQVIASDSAVIEMGNSSTQEARELRDLINMGSLPLKLEEKYTNSIGAKLGMESLKDTVTAGILGSVIVLVFMIIIFRLPGFVAAITIITYAWLLILVQNLMNATLTLPGIAAFVLGVGMAVDANIITAERIKEEIRSGKSMLSSLKAGSKSSFRTIMDANITGIISSAVLYFIGDGAIKGFALTMIFSILVSIVTNIYFARFLLDMLVRSNRFMKPGYYGVKESEIREL
ncbi:protein translocase subunit SecD [Paenibacillus agaridevorans]|jgi:preprotein translocase subunit SecD|uniref:Protein translocase subunit SecD n=1 Tax=Paenibacillus agaridevorans TaxID=171404 RepID=A0A2R5EZA6_9BACL|nr:protein translocase subunit SecD [Paenibacillus agaridevorans]GBG08721.1 protein translocase subunit SecD [Paenibacillus agaridevorans]